MENTELERKAYTIKEVAQMLNVTPLTVWKYIKEGKLKSVQPLGKHLISAEALDHFLNPQTK
jgi:excisionase family DNA binding protein